MDDLSFDKKRKIVLRLLGYGLLIIGMILAIYSLLNFFDVFNGFIEKDTIVQKTNAETISSVTFIVTFIGFLLLIVGSFFLKFGYDGTSKKFIHNENDNIKKASESINYILSRKENK
ncbi:hypothetical protein [Haploplasma axanthum]|uniref:Uncharacterized protein n=1 Tax=Haploplasma axanthum TaxID=29552 RepID=A0A449BEL9_HAPAX|nr:hypothetical protein [Haploplasma axanthum]VEU80903.1 Uncharacterised protein [Haploplasma axanthum]